MQEHLSKVNLSSQEFFFLIFAFLISAILYQVIHRYRQQDTHVSISFALALSMFV